MAKHTPKCGQCNRDSIRHPMYDAHYCESCNQWDEPQCDDGSCGFCVGRPDTPFPIIPKYKLVTATSLPDPF